ncbi:MAG: tetratricopeptide repeat protein [Hyphomicrobiaceae bacterium]
MKSQNLAPDNRPAQSLAPGRKSKSEAASRVLPHLPPATGPDGRQGNDPAYDAFEEGRYLTALSLAAKDAAKGSGVAHTLVARIHAEGLGVPQNYVLAAQWYERGAALGDPEAMLGLGLLYARGLGVKKDLVRAGDLIEKAASKGHAEACYNLALLFLAGTGKPENPARAFLLMRYAAEQGVVAAMYDLGTLYATGTGSGIEPNAFEAAKWIGAAAREHYAEAELEYALILFKGQGTPPDARRAVAYLKSASSKGLPVAQNRLARAYAGGIGVRANPVEAAKWHLIAKAGGVTDARLDEAFEKLSSADRLKAAQAAAQWREAILFE